MWTLCSLEAEGGQVCSLAHGTVSSESMFGGTDGQQTDSHVLCASEMKSAYLMSKKLYFIKFRTHGQKS